MGWIETKRDWKPNDGLQDTDLNRIEGNIEYLHRIRITGNASANTTFTPTTLYDVQNITIKIPAHKKAMFGVVSTCIGINEWDDDKKDLRLCLTTRPEDNATSGEFIADKAYEFYSELNTCFWRNDTDADILWPVRVGLRNVGTSNMVLGLGDGWMVEVYFEDI